MAERPPRSCLSLLGKSSDLTRLVFRIIVYFQAGRAVPFVGSQVASDVGEVRSIVPDWHRSIRLGLSFNGCGALVLLDSIGSAASGPDADMRICL